MQSNEKLTAVLIFTLLNFSPKLAAGLDRERYRTDACFLKFSLQLDLFSLISPSSLLATTEQLRLLFLFKSKQTCSVELSQNICHETYCQSSQGLRYGVDLRPCNSQEHKKMIYFQYILSWEFNKNWTLSKQNLAEEQAVIFFVGMANQEFFQTCFQYKELDFDKKSKKAHFSISLLKKSDPETSSVEKKPNLFSFFPATVTENSKKIEE